MLNQVEDAVAQLQQTFGPEYGRLAILARECHIRTGCNHSITINPKLIRFSDKDAWTFPVTLTNLNDGNYIDIPAGTFCLEHEIILTPIIDETSTLYSTVFFSTVKLHSSVLHNLQIAGEIVRELHRRGGATRKGFKLGMHHMDGLRILESENASRFLLSSMY